MKKKKRAEVAFGWTSSLGSQQNSYRHLLLLRRHPRSTSRRAGRLVHTPVTDVIIRTHAAVHIHPHTWVESGKYRAQKQKGTPLPHHTHTQTSSKTCRPIPFSSGRNVNPGGFLMLGFSTHGHTNTHPGGVYTVARNVRK